MRPGTDPGSLPLLQCGNDLGCDVFANVVLAGHCTAPVLGEQRSDVQENFVSALGEKRTWTQDMGNDIGRTLPEAARMTTHALDGMVRKPLETKLDASPGDHRADLADSLPDHNRVVRLRVRAGDQKEGAVVGGFAVRHQSRGECDLHANSIWNAELAIGCGGHSDRLDNDHLDDGRHLETLSMGRPGSGAVFCLGFDSDGAATEHDLDELGKVSS